MEIKKTTLVGTMKDYEKLLHETYSMLEKLDRVGMLLNDTMYFLNDSERCASEWLNYKSVKEKLTELKELLEVLTGEKK